MRAEMIVQLDAGTPTILTFVRFFIHGIPGTDALSLLTRYSAGVSGSSCAAILKMMLQAGAGMCRRGCSTAPSAVPAALQHG